MYSRTNRDVQLLSAYIKSKAPKELWDKLIPSYGTHRVALSFAVV